MIYINQLIYMSNPSASHKSTNTSTICGKETGCAKHASSLRFVALLAVSNDDVEEPENPFGGACCLHLLLTIKSITSSISISFACLLQGFLVCG